LLGQPFRPYKQAHFQRMGFPGSLVDFIFQDGFKRLNDTSIAIIDRANRGSPPCESGQLFLFIPVHFVG
jgi:hypothetical protein